MGRMTTIQVDASDAVEDRPGLDIRTYGPRSTGSERREQVDQIPHRRTPSMPNANSVTRWVAGLHSPDLGVRDEAARRIWQRFAGELHGLVRHRLNARVRVREDEHDIVQSTFASY